MFWVRKKVVAMPTHTQVSPNFVIKRMVWTWSKLRWIPSNRTTHSPIPRIWPLGQMSSHAREWCGPQASDTHWLVYCSLPNQESAMQIKYKTSRASFGLSVLRSAAPRLIISSVALPFCPILLLFYVRTQSKSVSSLNHRSWYPQMCLFHHHRFWPPNNRLAARGHWTLRSCRKDLLRIGPQQIDSLMRLCENSHYMLSVVGPMSG